MAISSEQKCSICRFSCKSDEYKVFCKFYPKNEFLGYGVKEDDVGSTRRTCVVCKSSLNYRKMHWKEERDLWYPMCKECVRNALIVDEIVGLVG